MLEFGQSSKAYDLMLNDPLGRTIMQIIKQAGNSESGLAIARKAGGDPKSVAEKLQSLRETGLLNSDGGSDLSAYYYLTSLAFQLPRST